MSSDPQDSMKSNGASSEPTSAAAAAAATEDTNDMYDESSSHPMLKGSDIASVLQSEGPTVTAVLLRHIRPDGKDTKPHAHVDESPDHKKKANGHDNTTKNNHRPILEELIQEVQVDTTPSRNNVQEILGGSFSFLGQWPSEGTVAMVRQDFTSELPRNLAKQSIGKLRKFCHFLDIDTSQMVEKSELVTALEERKSEALPLNPHLLQPPLHKLPAARGDILVMKVAETKEELDDDDDDDDEKEDGNKEDVNDNEDEKDDTAKTSDQKEEDDDDEENDSSKPAELEMMSNDEFFLSYTKEEYIKFASRTDLLEEAEQAEQEAKANGEGEDEEADEEEDSEEDEDEEGEHDDEDDEDEDFQLNNGEMDKHTLLNIILGGVIGKFREDNGRGPNTDELLELRKAVASELEVEVPEIPTTTEEDERKRPASASAHGASNKRVKFSQDQDETAAPKDDDDQKPQAKETAQAEEEGKEEKTD